MALTGQGLAEYAKSKKNTPYFYGAKMQKLTNEFMAEMHILYPTVVTDVYMQKAKRKGQVGKINVDCSGLISAYTKKLLGSAQLYSTAKNRMKINTWKDWAVGVIVWKQGHVGVYIGDGKVIEAKGIDYGVIESKITDTPWKYGLTFDWFSYEYEKKVSGTKKSKSPYDEPSSNLKKGCTGEGVKWLQNELVEAGYNLKVDGIFGTKTNSVLRKFQKSAKITVDGICGKQTRKALKED